MQAASTGIKTFFYVNNFHHPHVLKAMDVSFATYFAMLAHEMLTRDLNSGFSF